MRRWLLVPTAAALLAACGDDSTPRPSAPEVPPAAFAASQREVSARLGLPASFTNDLGMRFELIPPALFPMGTPLSDPSHRDDETPHSVDLFGTYYMQADEVPASAVAAWKGTKDAAEGAARGVDHDGAKAFAEWLTKRDPTWNYRLPTEAEWESAARAAGPATIRATTGGVWEWSRDWYGPYEDFQIMNPTGPKTGEERSLRGGGSRIAERRHAKPGHAAEDVGFRLMAVVPYAKADLGTCEITFRSMDTDVSGAPVTEHPGFEVRFISVFDRLSSRQQDVDLPWKVIAGRTTPFVWHVPPGRYYAQAQVPGSEELRGREEKIYLDSTMPQSQVVTLPTPKKGGLLPKPQ